jgi:PLP dependent protein
MAIPPLGLNIERLQTFFAAASNLRQQIETDRTTPHHNIAELSMGMSGDYLLAISAGATIVRLGSIIFGDRIKE